MANAGGEAAGAAAGAADRVAPTLLDPRSEEEEAEKVVEALQLPYEKPMLEVSADGFPLPISSITIV